MLKSVQCKTSHRDRARLRPGCLGNQNRDNFKTKVTAIGAGLSIRSPWPAHSGKSGRGQRVQRERIVDKIVAMIVIGILAAIGFFDLGQEAYTLAALLLGIGALLDYGRKRTAD